MMLGTLLPSSEKIMQGLGMGSEVCPHTYHVMRGCSPTSLRVGRVSYSVLANLAAFCCGTSMLNVEKLM